MFKKENWILMKGWFYTRISLPQDLTTNVHNSWQKLNKIQCTVFSRLCLDFCL